jgi:hypothetical protein
MKKPSLLYIVALYFTAALFVSSCTKDIHSLNVDPKRYAEVPAAALFLQGEKDLSDAYTSTSVSSAPFRVIAQEWTENAYVTEAQYNFSAYNAPDGWWNNLYGGNTAGNPGALNNFYQAKLAFMKDSSQPKIQKNNLIITDILEVYTYHLLAATYGDIPYGQAENPKIPFPKYDDAKTVYTDLLHRLDTCIADINTSVGAMGNSDQIYYGNTAEWKKFAATLKLKIGLLLADEDPAAAAKAITGAVASGIFTSADDNALFHYDKSSPGNSSMLWQALVNSGRHDFLPANLLVSTMVKWGDPRLPLYFTTTTTGKYTGGSAGGKNGYDNTRYSDFSAQLQTPDLSGDLLDYSEAQFYLAEAAARDIAVGGTPAKFYANAITASIKFWGGSATEAAVYLLRPGVNYLTAAGSWQQKIGYQEWISFYNRNWDAWTTIRRLGYPDINKVSPPIGAVSDLPLRYPYPTTEATSNPVNWKAAVQKLPGGKDVVSAKLFWMK